MSKFQTETFFERIRPAARRSGFEVTPFAMVAQMPLLVLQRPSANPEPSCHCYLSAGIHGDEPAGPLAILRLLQNQALPSACAWTVFPLLNPVGMDAGLRENGQNRDLNREYFSGDSPEVTAHRNWLSHHAPDRGYDLGLLLHEDWEASGFYLYELTPPGEKSFAPDILEQAASCIPLENSPEIDGYPAQNGRIAPLESGDIDLDCEDELPGAEAIYLFKKYTRHSITLETPSSLPTPQRVDAHVEGILAAVNAVTTGIDQ